MSESEKYKQFAADCLRIAETFFFFLKKKKKKKEKALEAETIVLSRKKNPGDDAARP